MRKKCAAQDCHRVISIRQKQKGSGSQRRYCIACIINRRNECSRDWYKRNQKNVCKRMMKVYYNAPLIFLVKGRKRDRKIKIETLTYYGDGKLQCTWSGCNVSDLDCLTLDHVKNNGRDHRAKGFPTGVPAMRCLRKLEYPNGFQTLCANHQLKKEILRKRRERT